MHLTGFIKRYMHMFGPLLLLSLLSTTASADIYTTIGDMCRLADALGVLIVSLMGARWIIADSAQERAESKKGIIYVVVGLLVVHSMTLLMRNLYEQPAKSAGIDVGGIPNVPGC